jgi:uncharacterized membrane protein
MVIHFPIALLMAGFLSEIIALFRKRLFFHQARFYLLLLGTLGSVIAYLTGNAAGEGMEEGELAKAIQLHEQAASLTLWLTVTTAIMYIGIYFFQIKKIWINILSLLLFAGVIGSVARTGYLGGQLVYKHGAGVELALPDFSGSIEK